MSFVVQDEKYRTTDRGTHSCQYLVAFCTKFNRNLLEGKCIEQIADVLKETAKKNNFGVTDIEIQSNYVQMMIEAPPDISIQKLLNKFKIEVAHALYEMYPELRSRTSSIWTRQNFISTVGNVSPVSVQKYVKNQRKDGGFCDEQNPT